MVNLKQSSKGLQENMEAAKHNILLRGYFNKKAKEVEKKKKDTEEKKQEEKKWKFNWINLCLIFLPISLMDTMQITGTDQYMY